MTRSLFIPMRNNGQNATIAVRGIPGVTQEELLEVGGLSEFGQKAYRILDVFDQFIGRVGRGAFLHCLLVVAVATAVIMAAFLPGDYKLWIFGVLLMETLLFYAASRIHSVLRHVYLRTERKEV